MEEYIKGIYTKQIFKTENGYLVGLFKIKETNIKELEYYLNKTITFTGYIASMVEDDTYILKGEVVEHPKYGLQYNVSTTDFAKEGPIPLNKSLLKNSIIPSLSSGRTRSYSDTLYCNPYFGCSTTSPFKI